MSRRRNNRWQRRQDTQLAALPTASGDNPAQGSPLPIFHRHNWLVITANAEVAVCPAQCAAARSPSQRPGGRAAAAAASGPGVFSEGRRLGAGEQPLQSAPRVPPLRARSNPVSSVLLQAPTRCSWYQQQQRHASDDLQARWPAAAGAAAAASGAAAPTLLTGRAVPCCDPAAAMPWSSYQSRTTTRLWTTRWTTCWSSWRCAAVQRCAGSLQQPAQGLAPAAQAVQHPSCWWQQQSSASTVRECGGCCGWSAGARLPRRAHVCLSPRLPALYSTLWRSWTTWMRM